MTIRMRVKLPKIGMTMEEATGSGMTVASDMGVPRSGESRCRHNVHP